MLSLARLTSRSFGFIAGPSVASAARFGSAQIRLLSSVEKEYQGEIKDILNQYEERKKRRQALVGEVVSVKCSKSITVRVEYQKYFPKYDKHISRHNKFMAHDEQEQCKLGDVVRIVPCRPMSKRKRHALIDIIRRPKLPMEDEERAEKTVPLEEVKVSASVEAK